MKVAIVIDELDMGGAQHVVYEIIRHIDKEKYETTVICTDGRTNSILEKQMLETAGPAGEPAGFPDRSNYRLMFLKNRNFKRLDSKFILINKAWNKIGRILLDILIIINLFYVLSKVKPDVIHAHQHGIWSFFWAFVSGAPMLTTVHTKPDVTFSRKTERLALKLSISAKKNVFVGISKYNCGLIKDCYKLDDRQLRCVNNGIETDDYYTADHKIFSFINVSRQDENKNQILLLKAFRRLVKNDHYSAVRLYLIGDGVRHNMLVKASHDMDIDDYVVFTGYIPSAKDYLAISDVYISSSHREGLPLSVLEAMASRLPIIATDVGGVRDLVQENGILIEDDDEDALYEAMKLLYGDPEKRKKMGNISRKIAEDFSAQTMTETYCRIYDELSTKK
jgi:glycosyltransferase involved in cell wall biosynthesis